MNSFYQEDRISKIKKKQRQLYWNLVYELYSKKQDKMYTESKQND